ncbi:MAG: carboxypeptidase-like regulatory domain-containing protein, partial [Bacteroidales bacterium]|nr:carboxypeptidase-like regulatory domain-containing protein [Bacteroidales bacterium]
MNKLIIIFLFSFLYFFIYPQNIDTLRISGSYSNITLTSFLNELEKELPVYFYFKEEWFTNEIISLNYSNLPLNVVLSKAIEGKAYIFQVIQNNMIIFLPKEEVAFIVGDMIDLSEEMADLSMIVIGDPNEAGKYKEVELKGYVKDGKTRESLIGATIQIENTTQGGITNLKGEYSLILKPGIYTLIISSIGYEKSVYKVKIISSGNLDIDLFEESLKIDEIAIYAQRADKNVRSSQMSIVELDARSIKQLPSITGDKDVLKSLTMMPGVKSVGEFGSGINVRGGGEDQNLYLIEGAPVFNTSHVFGLLSVINPDAVNYLTLYKGHIPAGYGERVSSVMDIQIKDNNSKKLGSKGGIGLYNSRLMIEGPIYKNLPGRQASKLTFKIGGRTSYSDYLLTRIPDYYLQNSSASFYDLNGLLNLNIKNNRFALFGYNSYDKFKYASDIAYEYENRLLSFNWAHFFNSNLGFNFLASASQYNVTKDDLKPEYEEKRIKSQIQYSSIKYNLTYSGIAKNTFDAGIQSIYYLIKPGNQSPLNDSSLIPREILMKEQAFENAIYINDVYEINNNISINAGLRYSRYDYIGPRTISQYIDNAPISPNSFIDTSAYNKG